MSDAAMPMTGPPDEKGPEGARRDKGASEETWKGICQRINDAGIRMVRCEIERAEWLVARTHQSQNAKESAPWLSEARALVESAARFADRVEFANGDGEELLQRMQRLREQMDGMERFPRD